MAQEEIDLMDIDNDFALSQDVESLGLDIINDDAEFSSEPILSEQNKNNELEIATDDFASDDDFEVNNDQNLDSNEVVTNNLQNESDKTREGNFLDDADISKIVDVKIDDDFSDQLKAVEVVNNSDEDDDFISDDSTLPIAIDVKPLADPVQDLSISELNDITKDGDVNVELSQEEAKDQERNSVLSRISKSISDAANVVVDKFSTNKENSDSKNIADANKADSGIKIAQKEDLVDVDKDKLAMEQKKQEEEKGSFGVRRKNKKARS